MADEPVPGLYEQLVTEELTRLLARLAPAQVAQSGLHVADAHLAVAGHLRRVLERVLRAIPEDERLARQAELSNALLAWLREASGADSVTADDALAVPLSLLREIKALDRGAAFARDTLQPLVPLSAADLLVNARGEPSVGAAIEREIHSADRIDLLCAFVRWNGLRVMRPALEAHRDAGRPLRVITTVYTGSTERKALDWLTSIGAEVKVSYDTRTTRLHAKAWLFERLSGYSTAFIGSSNLTHSAMLDGVEWNVRLAQASTPDLIDKFKAAFESYWQDPDYETYDPARDAQRFDVAVRSTAATAPSPIFNIDVQPWPYQARDAPAAGDRARTPPPPQEPCRSRHRHGQDPGRRVRLSPAARAAYRIRRCCLSPTGKKSWLRAWARIAPCFEMAPSASCWSTAIAQTRTACLRVHPVTRPDRPRRHSARRLRHRRRRRVPPRRRDDLSTPAESSETQDSAWPHRNT